MPTRKANAQWKGTLAKGEGTLSVAGQEFGYSFPSRFEDGDGTNPEELIAAAHAGCIAMALSHELSESGYKVNRVDASAEVTLGKVEDGFAITRISLSIEGDIDEIDPDVFKEYADSAKRNCPVSKALASVDSISLNAKLVR